MNRLTKDIFSCNAVRLAINILTVYVCYFVCRVAFLAENWAIFEQGMTLPTLLKVMRGGVLFDNSAIFYTNALVILLYLLPLAAKERGWYWNMTRWIYVVINSLCVLLNLGDSAFFEFRKHRTSLAVFSEFKGEDNIGGIVGVELVNHWYFVLLFAGLTALLWCLYLKPATPTRPRLRYYLTQSISLLLFVPVTLFAMRGNTFFSATRPIAVSFAHNYADEPVQTGIVLNTPFSIIRSVNHVPKETPVFFATQEELDAVYSPVHYPADSVQPNHKNIVILIVESFAAEFVGGLNRDLDGGTYRGYTPFFDEMLEKGTWFDQSFANTYYSIDAPPAVLASIPRMDTPFVLSPYSLNHIGSIASETAKAGYTTAFFHGADNQSLGINAFVTSVGFENYYGKDEYLADKRFGGMDDFDGKWGIWDEPFLQYFNTKLSEMPEPFMASVFTLSSHHPFKIPEQYRDTFPDEGLHQLHKCIRYTDHSLRRFFESASQQPWYDHTVFVITADHSSSKRTHDIYFTSVGDFRIPILIYDPSGEIAPGRRPGIIQQIDIMPTLLNHIGYDRPYVAFGKDALNTPAEESWAFNWDLCPQYLQGDYVLRGDGTKVTDIFDYVHDPLLEHNLIDTFPDSLRQPMTDRMNAFIQAYMQRMKTDTAHL
ncbi:LTA synthase family protein [uncultured Duncaniella sp.]|uniref:LTA synthase family protein n=1 Tax=uncultured Duncaniella sp. TaxID=2768039 RepID=UPI00265A24F7|nr:LTA synthase family protein [uncultured Duncaniella sp.]